MKNSILIVGFILINLIVIYSFTNSNKEGKLKSATCNSWGKVCNSTCTGGSCSTGRTSIGGESLCFAEFLTLSSNVEQKEFQSKLIEYLETICKSNEEKVFLNSTKLIHQYINSNQGEDFKMEIKNRDAVASNLTSEFRTNIRDWIELH